MNDALLYVINRMSDHLNPDFKCIEVFLDLIKAFDIVYY